MLARILLTAIAVLVLAWVAVLLRDQQYVHDAVPLINKQHLSRADFDRSMGRLRDAEFLNPDSSLALARAKYYLLHGHAQSAAREVAALVRDEPDNLDAWRVLYLSTAGVDRAQAARAAAEVRRLDPLSKL